jgi:hypothetical protein
MPGYQDDGMPVLPDLDWKIRVSAGATVAFGSTRD